MLLNLTDLSSEPLYCQIFRQIRALVLTGRLGTGDPIPSIRDLARSHKVSVITVQKAYDELVREGLVIARRGKGYFVGDLTKADLVSLARNHCKESLRKSVELSLAEGVSAAAIRELVNELIHENSHNRDGG